MPVHSYGKTRKRQRSRVVRAMKESRAGMVNRSRAAGFLQSGAEKKAMVAHRGVAVRQRIGGIEFDGAFEQHKRALHPLGHAGIDIELGPQHKVVGIEAAGALALHPLDFGASYAWRDCTNRR